MQSFKPGTGNTLSQIHLSLASIGLLTTRVALSFVELVWSVSKS